jgi:capsid protein
MYFDLSATGNVTYDTERFKKSEDLKMLKKQEKEKIKKSGLKFDVLFGLDKDEESETETENTENS